MKSYQYPQYLYALIHTEASQNPDTGYWTEASSGWVLKGNCREETNGKGQVINGAGGQAIIFSSLIQMPKGTARIPEGTTVMALRNEAENVATLTDAWIVSGKKSGEVVAAGVCLKCDTGRLHSRIWI